MIPYVSSAYASSFASFSSPIYGKVFYTDVKLTNPKNNKSVTVTMLVDTGAANSRLDGSKYATPLGLDIKSGKGPYSSVGPSITSKEVSYAHDLQIQIGDLKTITGPVFVTIQKPLFNNLGWTGVLEKYQVKVEPTKLTYIELAQAAMANAQAYFRSRV